MFFCCFFCRATEINELGVFQSFGVDCKLFYLDRVLGGWLVRVSQGDRNGIVCITTIARCSKFERRFFNVSIFSSIAPVSARINVHGMSFFRVVRLILKGHDEGRRLSVTCSSFFAGLPCKKKARGRNFSLESWEMRVTRAFLNTLMHSHTHSHSCFPKIPLSISHLEATDTVKSRAEVLQLEEWPKNL